MSQLGPIRAKEGFCCNDTAIVASEVSFTLSTTLVIYESEMAQAREDLATELLVQLMIGLLTETTFWRKGTNKRNRHSWLCFAVKICVFHRSVI